MNVTNRTQAPRTRRLGAVVLVIVAISVIAVWTYSRDHRSSPGELEQASLRLKWTYSAGFAGPIVADKLGYFREQGLDLAIQPGGAGLDPIQLVAGGSDTFGLSGADRLIQARAQGLPLVAIALENRHSFACFIALEESDIENPHDFPGRRVGVFRDDTYTVYKALVRTLGLPEQDIEEVPVGYDLSPLLQGVVDIYSAYRINQPPRLQVRGIPHVVIRPEDYGVDFAGNVYFTRKDVVAQQPQLVRAFVEGLLRGWQHTQSNPREAIEMVLEEQPSLDRAEESALLDALLAEFRQDMEERLFLSVTPEDLQGTQEIMLNQELVNSPVDLEATVEGQFVIRAHEEVASR